MVGTMKKNRGQKSLKKQNKGSINPLSWRDSARNYKHFCLHCFKTFKQGNKCCGHTTLVIHPDARPPKQRDGKAKWRQFFQLFLSGYLAKEPLQIERIIAIREEYGLPVFKQEKRLEEMLAIKEETIGNFDIRKHEAITKQVINGDSDVELLSKVIDSAHKTTVNESDYKHNTLYYIVPITSRNNSELIIPTKSGYFNVYKARCYKSSTQLNFELHIKIGSNKEIIPTKSPSVEIYSYFSKRYSYRQQLLCFDSKVKALAFRQSFLTALLPILKKEEINYSNEIVKIINLDYDRVTKKAPELLI